MLINSLSTHYSAAPYSRFPIPDSRFPTPDSSIFIRIKNNLFFFNQRKYFFLRKVKTFRIINNYEFLL
ncbi:MULTISPECIES: hypothetical protein [unclassified Moorena]|uniref:hypothetical protein n=1 Tax=unclassified Moorena TaxID=2683338 RepID=UPI0014008813|nr:MULTISPECIES: hypothetical protein [unclassified Moorena]NEO15375.1 hypothetical protein [Moorena sp. SIO3E8]NEQ01123.1 hypothetical protein [Moorena sp. SIO3F7]